MGAPADIPTSYFAACLHMAYPGKRDRGWYVASRANVAETLLDMRLKERYNEDSPGYAVRVFSEAGALNKQQAIHQALGATGSPIQPG